MIKYQDLINGPSLFSERFDFKLIQGNIISGSLATPGAKTIGIRPCPPGVAGTNTDYYVRISGGVGTAETVKITGGTAVSGGDSGTLQFTTVNSHTGNWSITSATAGISEAIWSMTTGVGGTILIPAGPATIYGPVKRRTNMAIWIVGAGQESTVLNVSTDFSLSELGVFNWSPADNPFQPVYDSGGLSRLTIRFTQPISSNLAVYTHWPPAFYVSGAIRPTLREMSIQGAWDGVKMDGLSTGNSGASFIDMTGSWFHRMFDLDMSYDTIRIENFQGALFGLVGDQWNAVLNNKGLVVAFYIGRVDDLKIINCTVLAALADFHSGADSSGCQCTIEGVWADSGGYVQTDGLVRIVGGNIGGNVPGQPSINYLGGQLTIENITTSNSVGFPVFYGIPANGQVLAPVAYPPLLSVLNCSILTLDNNLAQQVFLSTQAPFTGIFEARFEDCLFDRYPNIAYVAPSLLVFSGTGDTRLTAIGNVWRDKETGSGNAINFAVDSFHNVVGNQGGGYGFGPPPTRTKFNWQGNINFSSALSNVITSQRILGGVSPNTFSPLQTENYIATETGSNNAIAGALLDAALIAIPLAAGLKVTIKLAHTLQAGANTFNLNAGGAVNIKSARNPANNIATAYAATGMVTLLYDGTQWVDVSQ